MNKTEVLKTAVCKQRCRYYKPGKNEELACRGFFVVQRLLDSGRDLASEVSGRMPLSGPAQHSALREWMCPDCPFFAEDCDFILTQGSAPPCGGFVFLSFVLTEGIITIDDIAAAISRRP